MTSSPRSYLAPGSQFLSRHISIYNKKKCLSRSHRTVLDLVGIAAKNEFEDELAEGLEPTHITFRHYYSSNSNIPTPTQPNPALHNTHYNIL